MPQIFRSTGPRTAPTARARVGGIAVLLLLAWRLPEAAAQNVPLISGAAGMLGTVNAGSNYMQPVLDPLVAAPLGDHLLAEARFDFREFYSQNGNTGPYYSTFFKSTQLLQLDYIANPKLTLVVGRFLTPFNTYNERLSALWIQNFQDAPIVFSLGTRTTGSSDGLMLRGNAYASDKVEINYTTYFSASTKIDQFQAARAAGDRIDVYFPGTRVEVGSSYARFLQSTRYNTFGAHFYWLPWRLPLQVRSEYAHGPGAQGYWIETSYRLSQFKGRDSLVGRIEPLFRMQQSFRNRPFSGDGVPGVDVKQADFGLDYHFPHEVRFNSSYSRKLAGSGNANIWDMSLTYRFLFPAWRGKKL